MAGVKLNLKPRYAHLFDTHAKGEPRQRIAHLYQTIRMRPAIFGKYVKDMDNVKPACAVIFRSDIGETVESLLGKLSPTELQTLGCTIDAIDYARRAEIAIYKRDPPSFSLLTEHPEGGLIIGKHVTQEEKDQIMWRLWYILAMLMVDDDGLVDEEQTPWDENCLSVTLYCWVKHLMGVTACISEATCRCANIARTYGVPASAFRAAWVYVDKRCHHWLPSDRYTTIPVSSLAPEIRMTDIFLDTAAPEKPPTMASVIHLPIPPYHSVRLKPSSSRSLSSMTPSTSARRSKKTNGAVSCDPFEDVAEIPIHTSFHRNYAEITAAKSGGFYYDEITKLVSRSITLKQEIHSKLRSITLRENEWIVVGWALVYRRQLGLCIQDICGVIPSPTESFKPWHIGRLIDVLVYMHVRKRGTSRTHKNIHGYYPSFRTLVLSAKLSNSKRSAGHTTQDESLRRWVLLRALWDLLGRLFVWEDSNVKSFGGGSGSLSTAQMNESIEPTFVIDWKSLAFPLAITAWVKHSLFYSTCYLSVNEANCECKNACKLYNVSYDEFLAAFRVVDSICKREGWTVDILTYSRASDSEGARALGMAGTSKAGKASSVSSPVLQTPVTITSGAGDHPPCFRNLESTSGGNQYKSNRPTLTGSPERTTSTNTKGPALALSTGASLLQTYNKATGLPSTPPKKSNKCIPSPRIQDKSTPTDLSFRRRVSFKTSNRFESSAFQEDWCEDSLNSDLDRDFEPDQNFHGSDETDRVERRPRKTQPNVHADPGIKRGTRVTKSRKLIDWSSESSDGATLDVFRKRNRRERASTLVPVPSDGEDEKPRDRPPKIGPSRISDPRDRPRRTPMAMSASPDSHLDLQKDQFRHTPDVIESDKPNDAVARHPEVRVSAGHRSLVPMDVKGVPKPVNSQGGNHDGKSGSNPDPPDGNRDTAHRVTPAMRRALPARTRTLENKKRKYGQGDRLAPDSGATKPSQPEAKRSKREHPTVGTSEHQQIQRSTTHTSSLADVSLVIYDPSPDRRRPSLAEERRRLLNVCRLFGLAIPLDVQTVSENGGIGICEPLSAEVLTKLDHKKISYLRDHFGLILSYKPPAPLFHDPMTLSPRTSNRDLNPAKYLASLAGNDIGVHSKFEEQETLSFYDEQSELPTSLAEEADRLVGLIEEACRTDLQEMDWNIEMVHGHVAVVLRDQDAIRRACSMLAPTSIRKEISRRNLTVLRGEEVWVVPPGISRSLVSQKLHQRSCINVNARYQHNLALFDKTVAARSWTSAAVQGFHW